MAIDDFDNSLDDDGLGGTSTATASHHDEWEENLQDDGDHSDTRERTSARASNVDDDYDGDDHRVQPTPIWKILMWGGVAIAVGLVGLVAYALATKEPETPKVVMQPQAKPIKAAEPVAPAPGGYDPAVDTAATAGMTADPTQTAAVNNAVPTQIDTTISPFNAQAPGVTPAVNAAVNPAPAAAVAPATTALVATTPTTGVNAGVTAPTPVQAAPVMSPENKQDERIAALEAKLAELQEIINQLTAPKAKKVAAARKEPTTPVVKKEKSAATTLKQIASKDAPAANSITSATASEPVVTAVAAPVQKPAGRPHLVAIVPGRAFLQNSEGVRSDVSVGDSVAGCGTVIKIDTDNAEVVTDRCIIH